jgi:hypothetical protein
MRYNLSGEIPHSRIPFGMTGLKDLSRVQRSSTPIEGPLPFRGPGAMSTSPFAT